LQKYGSKEPPAYPVERITAPMTFMYSKNDYFSAVSVNGFVILIIIIFLKLRGAEQKIS